MLHFFSSFTLLLIYLNLVTLINISYEDSIIEVFNKCHCVEYYLCDEIASAKKCSGNKFCCKKTETANKNTQKCGKQMPRIEPRIFTDDEENSSVSNGEFPWIAAIFQSSLETGQYQFKCSGSLIHPEVVLTISHCINGASPYQLKVVVNGNKELKLYEDEAIADKRSVSHIVRHPKYISKNLFNDIALLFLDGSYDTTLKSSLNVICLPPQNYPIENSDCFVAGWGKTSKKDSINKELRAMKKVQLPLVDHYVCQAQLTKTRLGTHFNLDESFRCAGGEADRDACVGDGGSPRMCQIDGYYYQAGIVSWGIGCGSAKVPGVYTDVTKFNDWIFEELAKRKLSLVQTEMLNRDLNVELSEC